MVGILFELLNPLPDDKIPDSTNEEVKTIMKSAGLHEILNLALQNLNKNTVIVNILNNILRASSVLF